MVQLVTAQTIIDEDFEGGVLPMEWEIESMASDGGWRVGGADPLSSDAFEIPDNGSSSVIVTNDDDCNCDKLNDLLKTSTFDLTGIDAAVLSFDLFYLDNQYAGAQENATLEISIDNGENWEVVTDLEGETGWRLESADLTPWVDNAEVKLGLRYSDGGGWLLQMPLIM